MLRKGWQGFSCWCLWCVTEQGQGAKLPWCSHIPFTAFPGIMDWIKKKTTQFSLGSNRTQTPHTPRGSLALEPQDVWPWVRLRLPNIPGALGAVPALLPCSPQGLVLPAGNLIPKKWVWEASKLSSAPALLSFLSPVSAFCLWISPSQGSSITTPYPAGNKSRDPSTEGLSQPRVFPHCNL